VAEPGPLRRNGLVRLAIALILAPLFVSAIIALVQGGDQVPTSDFALTELRTRDVGSHAVLTGLYSRADWAHPGPALFYLLAVPYRLSGANPGGINVGALIINGAALVGMAAIARRLGGPPLALLTLLGGSLLARSLGADVIRDAWVPNISVLPYGLLLFLTWAMTCGHRWALPVAVGVGSFLVQTHVQYSVLALPLVAGGTWVMVTTRRRHHGFTPTVTVTIAVGAVMWFPPLVDQIIGGHNLAHIADYFQHPDEKLHTLGDGWRVVSAQFAAPPEWLTGFRRAEPGTAMPQDFHRAPLPALLLPVLIAAAWLWRGRRFDVLRLMGVLGLAAALGMLSVARTIGGVYAYRLQWAAVLAMVAAVAVVWISWLLLARRAPWSDPWLARGVVIGLLLLAGVNALAAAREDLAPAPPWDKHEAELAVLVPSVIAALPDRSGDVVLRAQGFGVWYTRGLLLALERSDIGARTQTDPSYVVGNHRVYRHGPVRAVFRVALQQEVASTLGRPGARLIAFTGTRPLWEYRRIATQTATLNRAHEAGRLSDEAWFRAVARLRPGSAIGVFLEQTSARGEQHRREAR
jgi:hypothetical protein